MKIVLGFFLALCLSTFAVGQEKKAPLPTGLTIEKTVAGPVKNKIVFIGGSNFFKPGEHDYLNGSALLMAMLEQTPGVSTVFALDWPEKPETLENAKAMVFLFDGGDKHQAIQKDRLNQIRQAAAKGVGIVQLHQSVDYPVSVSSRSLEWAGGVWDKAKGKRAHWVETFSTFPDHPIFYGVKPFRIDDGWLWNMRFVPEKKGIIPLLRTVQPKSRDDINSDSAIIAWAYERPEGGRSVNFSGGHLHKSFDEEGYRRFLTNAILWSAGLEVPKEGAKIDRIEKSVEK